MTCTSKLYQDSTVPKIVQILIDQYFYRMGESCSHVGALLFKVEAAVRLGYTSVACTSQPCKWNNDFVNKIQGEMIKNIQFYKKNLHQDQSH